MQKINAEIHWSEKNYCCGWGAEGIGTIMCTDKTLDGVKKAFKESLEFHIEGMVADGDNVPQWLIDKEYEINYILDVSALLRSIEPYTTMAAISRATGINQKQLSAPRTFVLCWVCCVLAILPCSSPAALSRPMPRLLAPARASSSA